MAQDETLDTAFRYKAHNGYLLTAPVLEVIGLHLTLKIKWDKNLAPPFLLGGASPTPNGRTYICVLKEKLC